MIGKYYNMTASQFVEYLGFSKYVAGRGNKAKKNTKLGWDINGDRPAISSFVQEYADFGIEHEKHALKFYADHMGKKGKDFNFILSNQKSFELHNFYSTKNGVISLSATPDGIQSDRCIEIKCGKKGKDVYSIKEIVDRYYPQIQGQLLVLIKLGYKPSKTHFVNWSYNTQQIYEILPNQQYFEYLEEHLKDYAKHLLSEKDFTEDSPSFSDDITKQLNLIYEEKKDA